RPARPCTGPSAPASATSSSGSCPCCPAHAGPAAPASLPLTEAARFGQPRPASARRRAWRARPAGRAAPTRPVAEFGQGSGPLTSPSCPVGGLAQGVAQLARLFDGEHRGFAGRADQDYPVSINQNSQIPLTVDDVAAANTPPLSVTFAVPPDVRRKFAIR